MNQPSNLNINQPSDVYAAYVCGFRIEKYDEMLSDLVIRYLTDIQLLLAHITSSTVEYNKFTEQLNQIHYNVLIHNMISALQQATTLHKEIQLYIHDISISFTPYEK